MTRPLATLPGHYYAGTSGLVLPFKNQQAYPPAFTGKSRLEVYGQLFSSLEVNSIFYKLPRAATLSGWTAAVPGHFRFTFKLWQQITHAPGLQFTQSDVQRYMELIAAADAKKGCILVQFPASVRPGVFAAVQLLLQTLQAYNTGWHIAVEFRHRSWYRPETFHMLNSCNATLVYHDKTGSEAPHEPLDAPFIYLRFHGPSGDYKGSYDEAFLQEYAGYIQEWLQDGKTVYAYFNNTMGSAIHNLQTLNRMVAQS